MPVTRLYKSLCLKVSLKSQPKICKLLTSNSSLYAPTNFLEWTFLGKNRENFEFPGQTRCFRLKKLRRFKILKSEENKLYQHCFTHGRPSLGQKLVPNCEIIILIVCSTHQFLHDGTSLIYYTAVFGTVGNSCKKLRTRDKCVVLLLGTIHLVYLLKFQARFTMNKLPIRKYLHEMTDALILYV